MICSSGIGFDPVVEGKRSLFGFHGIWQGTALLYDRETHSNWIHLTGECIEGPRKGQRLRPVTLRHVRFGEWKRDHPESDVMAWDPALERLYFPDADARRGHDFFPPPFLPTIRERDPRLPLSALCYGIAVDGAARAYPFSRLAEVRDGVVPDAIAGAPVVVVYDRATGSCAALSRALDGATLDFALAGPGRLRDRKSGSIFDLDGRCVAGALAGKRLPPITGVQAEWYGWYAAYPDTTIWEE